MTAPSKGYTPLQFGLHWIIVLLVFFQLVFGEGISQYRHAVHQGLDASGLLTGYYLHVIVGTTVLILAAIRFALRLKIGVPPPVPGPAFQIKLGIGLHHLFYVLLFAMPITGLIANYWLPALGPVHELGQPIFIVAIVLHVAAALYHHFVAKDSTLMRMLKPGTL